TNFTVDMALAFLLLVGGVLGAQIGTRIGLKLKAEQLRILLSLLVIAVCLKIAGDLVLQPSDLFSVDKGLSH
ncbi:MAG: putative membrane protein YfcA, partial [Paracoccaceae bacterium]